MAEQSALRQLLNQLPNLAMQLYRGVESKEDKEREDREWAEMLKQFDFSEKQRDYTETSWEDKTEEIERAIFANMLQTWKLHGTGEMTGELLNLWNKYGVGKPPRMGPISVYKTQKDFLIDEMAAKKAEWNRNAKIYTDKYNKLQQESIFGTAKEPSPYFSDAQAQFVDSEKYDKNQYALLKRFGVDINVPSDADAFLNSNLDTMLSSGITMGELAETPYNLELTPELYQTGLTRMSKHPDFMLGKDWERLYTDIVDEITNLKDSEGRSIGGITKDKELLNEVAYFIATDDFDMPEGIAKSFGGMATSDPMKLEKTVSLLDKYIENSESYTDYFDNLKEQTQYNKGRLGYTEDDNRRR